MPKLFELTNFDLSLSILLAMTVVGCQTQRELGEVHGRVSFRGNPITDATVLFRCQEQGVYMTAELDGHGRFQMVMAEGAGLPLGRYHVAVMPIHSLGGNMEIGSRPPPERLDIPRHVRRPETSGHVFQVSPGTNEVAIEFAP